MASNDVNVTGTLNVLVAARDAVVERVIYASSARCTATPTRCPFTRGCSRDLRLDSWSDIAAARDALGYGSAVTFEDGLRRTIEWIAREDAEIRR